MGDEKTKKIRKPHLWSMVLLEILMLLLIAVNLWIGYVGGARIDTMTKINRIILFGVTVAMALLTFWRYRKLLNYETCKNDIEQNDC